jgi:ATP-dependent Clp protease ATP-binding subunit ClpA
MAARTAADLDDLGERLLDHFVGAARSAGCSWSEIGAVLGVTKQGAQQRFVSPSAGGRLPDRFGEAAHVAMEVASEEARSLKHNYVGTEHVLLGLVRAEDSLAGQALSMLGIRAEDVRAQIRSMIGEGVVSHGELGVTPRTKRTFEAARRIALQLGNSCVRSEQLLLALIASEGVAPRILEVLGAPPERVREQVADILGIDASELAARLRSKRRLARARLAR